MTPQEQPVIVGAIVTALAGLAAKYGLTLDGDVTTAVTVIVGAVVTFVVRRAVTPNPRVPAAPQTPTQPAVEVDPAAAWKFPS